MRSPQLARCSRDQLRRRMGQHGAVLARGRGGGCEVFRAPPSLGRQLEARLSPRQRVGAGRRAASESTVVDALLATVPPVSLTRQLRPDGLWLCGLKSPGSRLRPPPSFYGDVTFFYTVTAPPRPAPPRSAPPRAAPPEPTASPCAALPHAALPRAAPPRPAPPVDRRTLRR